MRLILIHIQNNFWVKYHNGISYKSIILNIFESNGRKYNADPNVTSTLAENRTFAKMGDTNSRWNIAFNIILWNKQTKALPTLNRGNDEATTHGGSMAWGGTNPIPHTYSPLACWICVDHSHAVLLSCNIYSF